MNVEGYGRRGDRKESRLDNGITNVMDRIGGSAREFKPGRGCGNRERSSRHSRQIDWAVSGGTPITGPTAIALRRIVFGQCPSTIRAEYFSRGPGLVFREAERDLGYALIVSHAAALPVTSSMLMAIQSQILRILLFDVRPSRVHQPNPLKPSFSMQQEALCTAITDIIWKAGGSQYSVLCLPHPHQSYVETSDVFNADGVTEKLHLFECKNRDELQNVVRRYLYIFQQDPGPSLLLLIYSAVLSRGIDRIVEDMGTRWMNGTNSYGRSLMNFTGNVSFSALNLILTGRAVPYLHNGTHFSEDEETHVMVAEPGIHVRSPIGLLIWMRSEEKTAKYRLGSRLKTPLYPIWLVITADQSAVLFSNDRDLLRDYRSEIRFRLHYYTSSHHQSTPAILLIRTRQDDLVDEVVCQHTLAKVIRTKWSGAHVTWNGLTPFL